MSDVVERLMGLADAYARETETPYTVAGVTPRTVRAALEAELRSALDGARKDAERYRFMRENIDYTEVDDNSGYYWHNQRGEFEFAIATDGSFPDFETVIDSAMQQQQEGERG